MLIQQNTVNTHAHKYGPRAASINIWPHPAGGSLGASKTQGVRGSVKESCSFGAQREEQTRQQQLLLRGFPFNGLVFVLYIRKTVNNKYCVISLHLLLAPLAFCGGEGDREQHGRGCL